MTAFRCRRCGGPCLHFKGMVYHDDGKPRAGFGWTCRGCVDAIMDERVRRFDSQQPVPR